jgi:hypothetical protein
MPPIPMKCACCEVANMDVKDQGSRGRGQVSGFRVQGSGIRD